MKVVTFTRSTPDTAAKVWVDENGKVTWGDVATVVNPWDEYALEEAILQRDTGDGISYVVAVGPEMHEESLKHSLAMGIDEAIRVWDEGMDTTDSLIWATLAAGTVKKIGAVDLVLFGRESVDVGTDQHIYQTARKLGWAMLGSVSKIHDIDYGAKTIRVEKTLEQGKQIVTANLPVVVSVLKGINEPRYPSFMGIRKASKAQIPVWNVSDLGVELPEQKTKIIAYRNPPPRDIQTEIIEGETVQEKVAALVDRLFVEKVL